MQETIPNEGPSDLTTSPSREKARSRREWVPTWGTLPVQFRAGKLDHDLQTRAAPQGYSPSVGQVAARDLHRYYQHLRDALPRLNSREARVVMDALHAMPIEASMSCMLYSVVQDAVVLDHLDEKWGIEAGPLVRKLRGLSPIACQAVIDAVERAWHLLQHQPGATPVEALMATGLVPLEQSGHQSRWGYEERLD